MTGRPRRLLTIAHSYCVALNRRLADEMVRAGGGRWEVTAVAPRFMQGDLRPVPLEIREDERSGLEAVPVYLTKYLHFMFYGWRLRDLLRQPLDLVHCWEEPFNLAGAQVAWWTPRRTPFVFSTLQNLPKRYPLPFSAFERYCVGRCVGWLACGQSVVETLLPRRGYASRPHRVLPLGVDMTHFRPDAVARRRTRLELNWAEQGPAVVGYLGRFVPEKGLGLLMNALDGVRSDWRALFVGGGRLERELRRWASRYGHQVRIVTGVTHDQVPDYLNAMDLLCAPSETTASWREQQGRMLVEAFATGVPVIASNSGEIPHVIADAGMLAPERDRERWSRAIEGLIEDPVARAEFSGRGLARARAVYAWPVIARGHLQFFDDLVGG